MSETTHTGCHLYTLLHNMSAPPRTKVNVRPLKGVCEQEGSSDQKSVVPLGFREVYRMNTINFLNAHMPICCERRATPSIFQKNPVKGVMAAYRCAAWWR